ncbi:MAG: 4-hydroxythreonine-4-phosphate dehydrogenase PdxA [Elusimicrobia bacterium]|nr:4-hydroxythreonine-4-phosphate dehydrogenase PdxA [Elusimicrobiota bacterium]
MSATSPRISRTIGPRLPPRTLAFTCGDPAGVGPRGALASLRAGALPRGVSPVLVGEASVWRRAGWRPSDGPIRDTALGLPAPRPGRPTDAGGKMSAASFEEALTLVARGLAGGVVTAPISKASWSRAGYPWRDHTERLADFAGKPDAQMVLGVPSRGLWCAIATRHVPLKEVPRALNARSIAACAETLVAALRELGNQKPRIALCGLNPHAGEHGLIGTEEQELLAPLAARLGIDGPLPADSAWRLHIEGVYDGLVCLYHDQALIPLKALGGLAGVNWTVGIPFVRTSPAHGTAYEAAAAGRLDPAAAIESARLAARLLA